MSKVAGSIPGWGGRFSGWENRKHACHMIMWHVKNPLSTRLAWILSAKLKISAYFNIHRELRFIVIWASKLVMRAVIFYSVVFFAFVVFSTDYYCKQTSQSGFFLENILVLRNEYVCSQIWVCTYSEMSRCVLRNEYVLSQKWACAFSEMSMCVLKNKYVHTQKWVCP